MCLPIYTQLLDIFVLVSEADRGTLFPNFQIINFIYLGVFHEIIKRVLKWRSRDLIPPEPFFGFL